MHIRRSVLLGAVAGLVASTALVTPATARTSGAAVGGSSHGPVTVVKKLNNPRQISLTTGGSLLIAEAGKGGPNCDPEGCFGATGSVAWVPAPSVQRNSNPLRIVRGLISTAGPDGTFALGADGVSARSLAEIYSIVTSAPPDVVVPPNTPRNQLGKLLRSRIFGTPRAVANATAFEVAKDPDKQGIESNPYAVLALPEKVLIADAAGNSILQWKNGRLSLFAVLGNITTGACAGRPNDNGTTGCDAVPTNLAVGPDGHVYVSLLGAEAPGAGRVLKLHRWTGSVLRSWGNLTAATGVAVDSHGTIYVSQLFTAFGPMGPDLFSGKLTRIRTNGARTNLTVPTPAGVAVDKWHNVYVAVWSIAPETGAFGIPNSDGKVWRLRF